MYVVTITNEGSTKIINSAGVLVLGRGHISHIVKLLCFSLLPGIDQTNQVCSNDDHRRVYQNCKIIVNMYFFFSINILHIDCYCVKDYDSAFKYNC